MHGQKASLYMDEKLGKGHTGAGRVQVGGSRVREPGGQHELCLGTIGSQLSSGNDEEWFLWYR